MMMVMMLIFDPAVAVFKMPRQAQGRRAVLTVLTVLLGLTGLCGQGLTFAWTLWAALPGLLFFLGAFSLPWIASLLTWFE